MSADRAKMRRRLIAPLAWWLAFHAVPGAALNRIEVQALMQDAAMLRIDGAQRLLRSGQRSPEGVTLVRADPRRALIEVDGSRRELTLSQRIAGNFEQTAATEVQITRDNNHQYLTNGEINGRRLLLLVDTGASSVALSAAQALSLGIDYRHGTPTRVSTAGGVKPAWGVTLDKVNVGGIAVNYVPAVVVEGDFPQIALLGISYLRHVGLREENGVMYLQQKY